jgi:hypothetical protein
VHNFQDSQQLFEQVSYITKDALKLSSLDFSETPELSIYSVQLLTSHY